ncbi:GNAT family N-acetyltransferase [Apibacter muscae]|uniref:GNAT family N-acetyltransferase n=1 Tax=Apibacter muscae TaxID=2509004 RepID=A0A563DHN6_9FLAO|nr:GNAT family N-acetyltransferase [Apibacter muscae]TWP29715.1 GNAT family N-acetyltransferase [Apibacter muscae]
MQNKSVELSLKIKRFNELSIIELYHLLKLRSEVFIIEQNSIYQDLDDKDLEAYHILIYIKNELGAYSRILPKNISFTEASIGRVVVKNKFRSIGLGKILMNESIENLYNLLGKQPIKISAQFYATNFYKKLGFEVIGKTYFEDGIEHIEMLKK